MNYALLTENNAAIYLKYSTTVNFKSYLLIADAANNLMRKLSKE